MPGLPIVCFLNCYFSLIFGLMLSSMYLTPTIVFSFRVKSDSVFINNFRKFTDDCEIARKQLQEKSNQRQLRWPSGMERLSLEL